MEIVFRWLNASEWDWGSLVGFQLLLQSLQNRHNDNDDDDDDDDDDDNHRLSAQPTFT